MVEVVKYNGGPEVLAWKYPGEELGTWTQLIVNESQEAVLYKGGKALDVFGSGRHTLETANIPILNKLINLPFGGKSPFSAEVWYVNKIFSLDVKWGTPTPIQIQDPKYGIFAPIRSNGMFGIQIEDSKKFLVKLVGTLPTFERDSLIKYFRGLYVTKVKDAISSYVVHKKISVLEINAYIDELSAYMKERIQPVMAEFGIRLLGFYVNDISVPEEDPAIQKLKDALSKKAEMDIIGYSYQQERSFDTLEGAATNTGSGSASLMGAGIGLGMGVNLGGAVGNSFGALTQEMSVAGKTAVQTCPNCMTVLQPGHRFCGSCGFDTTKKETGAIVCSECGGAMNRQTKFCPQCGNPYRPCPECGADLKADSTTCHQCGYCLPSPCPKCGAKHNKGVKFCPECGELLEKRCGKCQAVLGDQHKFCPECGERLS